MEFFHFLCHSHGDRLPIDVKYEAANSLEDQDLVEPTDEMIISNLLSARKEAKELASKNTSAMTAKAKGIL